MILGWIDEQCIKSSAKDSRTKHFDRLPNIVRISCVWHYFARPFNHFVFLPIPTSLEKHWYYALSDPEIRVSLNGVYWYISTGVYTMNGSTWYFSKERLNIRHFFLRKRFTRFLWTWSYNYNTSQGPITNQCLWSVCLMLHLNNNFIWIFPVVS